MMTTFDFKNGNGPVPAHQHEHGGGWVADTAKVSDTVFVGQNAQVFGNARVFDNALVFGDAQVSGNALVFGNAQVFDNAQVSGDAQVFGNARVFGDAVIVVRLPIITRSDGYSFIYVDCADGIKRIQAGCRNFTLEEAVAHWSSETYRDKKLGKESLMHVNHLVALDSP